MLFYGAMRKPAAADAMAKAIEARAIFDDAKASFFGVTVDPADDSEATNDRLPGIRHFLDFDLSISRAFGRTPAAGAASATYAPGWVVLDPSLRVIGIFDLAKSDDALAFIRALPPVDDHAAAPLNAPVLVAPRILEPELCRELIARYEEHGGEASGFMREIDGRTVPIVDPNFKRRSDHHIADDALKRSLAARINARLRPLIVRAFQFDANRMERYVVACYDADARGHFRAHRDNTTKGTAHRRFAVTINLNAEDYEGGDLRFPEFGSRRYRAPTGGAVVFSCSLLHEALPVTRGRRYAFLPFLYDDAAAAVREANNSFLDESVEPYRRG